MKVDLRDRQELPYKVMQHLSSKNSACTKLLTFTLLTLRDNILFWTTRFGDFTPLSSLTNGVKAPEPVVGNYMLYRRTSNLIVSKFKGNKKYTFVNCLD